MALLLRTAGFHVFEADSAGSARGALEDRGDPLNDFGIGPGDLDVILGPDSGVSLAALDQATSARPGDHADVWLVEFQEVREGMPRSVPFLQKPFTSKALLQLVERTLQRR